MYIAEHLGDISVPEFEFPDLEALWVKVKVDQISCCSMYVTDHLLNAKLDFWNTLQDSLDQSKQSGYVDILMAGDFNADPQTRDGHLFELFIVANNLTAYIDEATRITPNSALILDRFVYTNRRIYESEMPILFPHVTIVQFKLM